MVFRFLLYGVLGCCADVLWNGLAPFVSEGAFEWTLPATTGLWIFLACGAGGVVVLEPLHRRIRRWPWFLRGILYVPAIWSVQAALGLAFHGTVGGVPWAPQAAVGELERWMRFELAPLWFVIGLAFERLHLWITELWLARRLVSRRRWRRRPVTARPERRSNAVARSAHRGTTR